MGVVNMSHGLVPLPSIASNAEFSETFDDIFESAERETSSYTK